MLLFYGYCTNLIAIQTHDQKKTPYSKPKAVGTSSSATKQNKKRTRGLNSVLASQTITIALLIIKPLLFVGIIAFLVSSNKGYQRLYEMNFAKLFKDIERYKGMSYTEKERKFFPSSYPIFDMITEGTPEDAVILIPPREIWYPKDKKLNLGQWMNREDYLTYFLYPRRVIIDDKSGVKSPLMQEVTHVLIIDSWGYDKLAYTVSDQRPYAILPIKR